MSDYIMDLNSDATTFQPTNASYYRRELKKAQAENAELRAKLDAWEKQYPIGWVCKCDDYTGSIIGDYKQWDDYSVPIYTKPKEA